MRKLLFAIGLSLALLTNGYCAWNAAKPADNEKLKDTPAFIRANWDAIATGTDAALLVTNAKVAAGAAIVDTKLAQITTAAKVSVSAITGTLPIANGGTALTTAGGTANRVMLTTNGTVFSVGQVDLATSQIKGELPVANGGTGLTGAGGVANRVVLTTDGAALSIGQVGLTTMVTGTLPVGNGGTGATAAANAANGVVVLDANSKISVAQFGAWVNKSSSYGAQQAATDGFVSVRCDQAIITGYTDGNADPTTVILQVGANDDSRNGFIMPVRKNDYWKITVSQNTPTVYWLPLGS